MRKLGILLTTAAAFAIAVPATSMAQGFSVDTPVGGVRVGEPAIVIIIAIATGTAASVSTTAMCTCAVAATVEL